MKVGIVAANNIRISPYVFPYTKLLDEMGIEYDVLFPNRNINMVDIYRFNTINVPWKNRNRKIANFYDYSKKIKNLCKDKYDFLIILTTVNGVFFYPWLKKYYSNKYILDIRDYTYENNLLYFEVEKRLIKRAKSVVISSPKYKHFLPKGDYTVMHNINNIDNDEYSFCLNEGRLRIGYVGSISYRNQCEKIIDLVNNDDRFELHFYGDGVDRIYLENYAQKYNNSRIKFHGPYLQEEKDDIIEQIDIIFNAYGNGKPLLDYALSNKLYDALKHHKLLLTSPNTYMNEVGGPLAYPINFDNNSLDGLYIWYKQINKDIIDSYSRKTLDSVKRENEKTRRLLEKVLCSQE